MLLDPRITYSPFEYEQAYKYWELQQQSHWLHCVAGDQRVCTSKGLLTVRELFEDQNELELFDNSKVVKSSPMFLTANRQVYNIHTKEGYTHKVTADHRVMTSKGWKEAQHLNPGDILCIQTNSGLFGSVHNPELGFLCGYWQGNGTSNKDNIIWQVWKHEYKFIEEIEKCIFQVYQKDNLISDKYQIPTFQKENNGSRHLTSMKLNKKWFQKNVVPEFIWLSDRETVFSYLRGLLITYGAVYQGKKHESIKLSQVDINYISDIQLLLLNCGIKSKLYKRNNCVRETPDDKGYTKLYPCKEFYILEIIDGNSVKILNEGTDIFKAKNKIFRGLKNFKKSHPVVNARFTYLEPLDFEDVYCVNVHSDEHSWICNGFITHNTEISMASDINDWKTNLSPIEKNVIGNILKGFTQSEVFIQEYWGSLVSSWFKKPEIQMMAAAFSAFESIHAVSYAYLNQSLGLEDFSAFLHEPTAKAKIDRLINTKGKTKEEIAKSLAIFSAFNEGVNLFSSFAVLLNFSRFNKMKGLGQIIAFSIKDESLHSEAGCWLFRTLLGEYPEIFTDELKKEIYDAARTTVDLEDAFIDKAFELGSIDGLNPNDLKNFIRYRTNTKLNDLGLKKNWKNIDKESLDRMSWFDTMSAGVSHSDFFASRVDSYAKGTYDWEKIWE